MTLTPRMNIVWAVLEAAQDAGDAKVVAACRRLIVANTLGWRKHHSPEDYQLVLSFAE